MAQKVLGYVGQWQGEVMGQGQGCSLFSTKVGRDVSK